MANIKPAKLGTFFALLTILYSFAMGAGFGLFEEKFKDHLKAEAEKVKDTAYKVEVVAPAPGQTDAEKAKAAEVHEANVKAKMKKVTDKSWVYLKRAHMHASGLGAIALAICVFLGIVSRCGFCKFVGSLFIGLGALGYSTFWMLAGLTAPGLGSTGAAKEALFYLAQPSAGLCVVGLLLTFMAFFKGCCGSGCTFED